MGKLGNSNGVVRISSFFQDDRTIFGILCGQRRAGFSKIPLIYHHYFVLHQHNTNLENNSNPLGARFFTSGCQTMLSVLKASLALVGIEEINDLLLVTESKQVPFALIELPEHLPSLERNYYERWSPSNLIAPPARGVSAIDGSFLDLPF